MKILLFLWYNLKEDTIISNKKIDSGGYAIVYARMQVYNDQEFNLINF